MHRGLKWWNGKSIFCWEISIISFVHTDRWCVNLYCCGILDKSSYTTFNHLWQQFPHWQLFDMFINEILMWLFSPPRVILTKWSCYNIEKLVDGFILLLWIYETSSSPNQEWGNFSLTSLIFVCTTGIMSHIQILYRQTRLGMFQATSYIFEAFSFFFT